MGVIAPRYTTTNTAIKAGKPFLLLLLTMLVNLWRQGAWLRITKVGVCDYSWTRQVFALLVSTRSWGNSYLNNLNSLVNECGPVDMIWLTLWWTWLFFMKILREPLMPFMFIGAAIHLLHGVFAERGSKRPTMPLPLVPVRLGGCSTPGRNAGTGPQ